MRCSYIFFSHRCVSPFSRRLIFTRAPVRSLYYPWGKMGTTRSLPKGWTERLPLWPFDLSFSFGRAPTSFSGSSLGKRVGIVLARERNVMRSIPGAGPILRVLKQPGNEGTSFACKWLDLRVAQMTTKNGGSVKGFVACMQNRTELHYDSKLFERFRCSITSTVGLMYLRE